MGFSLKDTFLGQVSALALAGTLFAQGMALADNNTPAAAPDATESDAIFAFFNACTFSGQIENPRSPEQKRLTQWYENLSLSPTAKATLDKALGYGMKICFDQALVEVDECAMRTFGQYDANRNQIQLNPDPRISSIFMKSTTGHESRHKIQEMIAPSNSLRTNIPPWERIAYSWLLEVDARVTEIAIAYEMGQKGQPEFLSFLEQIGKYQPLVAAFKAALIENAGDVRSAIRAAAITGMKKTPNFFSYADDMIAWEEAQNIKFNPYTEADTYMAESVLKSVTQTESYGNYMDETLLTAVRNVFSEDDYHARAAARAAAVRAPDGKADGVCVLEKDRVAAAPSTPVLSN